MGVIMMNLALCVIVALMGYLAYKKTSDELVLSLVVAFALFAVSHFLAVLGPAGAMLNIMIAIRVIAYLLIVLGLYRKIV